MSQTSGKKPYAQLPFSVSHVQFGNGFGFWRIDDALGRPVASSILWADDAVFIVEACNAHQEETA